MELSTQLIKSTETFLQNHGEETIKVAITEMVATSEKIKSSETLCIIAQCLKVHPHLWLYVIEKLDPEFPPFEDLHQRLHSEPLPKKRRTQGANFNFLNIIDLTS